MSNDAPEPPRYRQPLVAVLGHVDSGKTTLLDYIRKTRVAAKEPGSITQHVGASEIPAGVIREICQPVFDALGTSFTIKTGGLLFIDLPGHEVFTNLRKRGGSVADIAILVIDAFKGVEPQTVESINILRERRTPFVIAMNKIDLIRDWKSHPGRPFIISVNEQPPRAVSELENRMYSILGQLAKLGIGAERYDRVTDFTKTFSLVPTSAATGEGVPDLLAVLLGLVQRYMLDRLEITREEGLGVVLEVKEEPGLGKVITAIIYDGEIRVGDVVVLGGSRGPITTRVRALLRPRPMDEIRAPRFKFSRVGSARAASGVMISAPGLEDAMPGSTLFVVRDEAELEDVKRTLREEMAQILIRTDLEGVIVKADTLGSVEALVAQLRRFGIPVRRADVGSVSKADVFEAQAMRSSNPKYAAVLAFNVRVPDEVAREAASRGVKIIHDVIIYQLVDRFIEFLESEKAKEVEELLNRFPLPAKIRVIPGYVFRRSDPAIVGVEVLEGRLRPGVPLINERGRRVGTLIEIQDKGERIREASRGDKVAISVRGGVVGRGIKEGANLLVEVVEIYDAKVRELYFSLLSPGEVDLYRETVRLLRRAGER